MVGLQHAVAQLEVLALGVHGGEDQPQGCGLALCTHIDREA